MNNDDIDDIKEDVASIKTSIEYIKKAIDSLTPTVSTNTIDIKLLQTLLLAEKTKLENHLNTVKEEKNMRFRQYGLLFTIVTVIFTVVNVVIKLAFNI